MPSGHCPPTVETMDHPSKEACISGLAPQGVFVLHGKHANAVTLADLAHGCVCNFRFAGHFMTTSVRAAAAEAQPEWPLFGCRRNACDRRAWLGAPTPSNLIDAAVLLKAQSHEVEAIAAKKYACSSRFYSLGL